MTQPRRSYTYEGPATYRQGGWDCDDRISLGPADKYIGVDDLAQRIADVFGLDPDGCRELRIKVETL